VKRSLASLVVSVLLTVHAVAHAGHAKPGEYHWNLDTVKYIDSLSSNWDPLLVQTVADWNAGVDNIELKIKPGQSGNKVRKKCAPADKAIRVCNFPYNAPFLGEANYQTSFSTGHIKGGRIRFDDSDGFPALNVVCHEVGHTLGLDHRPGADFNKTCMTSPVFFAKPDAHDFAVVDDLHSFHLHAADAKSVTTRRRSGDTVWVTVRVYPR
jgi:hypothetical protein